MLYYSTNDKNLRHPLKTAVISGLAPDKGLYMPETIPMLSNDFWLKLPDMSLGDIGFETLRPFFCPDIPESAFQTLTREAFNFPVPLIPVNERLGALELFHGPTLAFKDIGARFLARVMAHFTRTDERPINVLVATSGDTGSAVANGFLGVKGVRVFVLYPKGLVSKVQEMQFTTLGQNITPIEIAGTFDDCQRLVKTAFMDEELREAMTLTSANSINVARFLPQMVYYFHAYAQAIKQGHRDVVVAVPSGNFGNLTAGLVAQRMGLPIKRFIAATNRNDVVPQYLATGHYAARPSIATPANAMDVGDPSNWARIEDLFQHDVTRIKAHLMAHAVDDATIFSSIKNFFASANYVLDPHGATACAILEEQLQNGEYGVFLGTAHPAKFPEAVELTLERTVEQPERLRAFMQGSKKSEQSSKSYDHFKELLCRKGGV
ncbi:MULTISPECIES: threonine synthase [unclassified Carboxylicivirga]|uniref:threonine synthase n=1 Tax=Carboxylicivirga TaxID=1628153 RepID=UPI003D354448